MQIYFNYDANSSFDNKTKNFHSQTQRDDQTQMVNGVELSSKEIEQVRQLQNIDRNVRAHEAAHQAVGGQFAGPASFSYVKGPDHQMYAVAGEVPIRLEKGRTPEETIANARQVAAAAMAPADPSPQDYKVAANAMKMEFEARVEAMKLKIEEAKQKKEENDEKEEKLNKNNENFQDDLKINRKNKNFITQVYEENSKNKEIIFNMVS